MFFKAGLGRANNIIQVGKCAREDTSSLYHWFKNDEKEKNP